MKLLLLATFFLLSVAAGSDIDFCDKRYLQHYKAKGCTAVLGSDPKCPSRYECPEVSDEQKNGCKYRGHIYKQGESVPVLNPCLICSCRKDYYSNDFSDGLKMSCIGIECPSIFGPRLNNSCYQVYDNFDQCCSSRIECSNGEEKLAAPEKVCDYNGKTYHLGEKIYSEEDSCISCLCTENFSGINGEGCKRYDCDLERKLADLQKGYIPIYHQGTCCPIQYYSGTPVPHNQTEPSQADIDAGLTCQYQGVHYKLGEKLDINDDCVTCKCAIPPEITCVHLQCNLDVPNGVDPSTCKLRHPKKKCCPTYECATIQSAPTPSRHCSPVSCPAGCSEVTIENSCPFCQCQEKICAPPKCSEGCQIKLDVANGECPTCECPEGIQVPILCLNVSCPSNCMTVKDNFGCDACVCGALCSPPNCAPNCEIERNVAVGECPRCNCHEETQIPGSVQCSPVKCPESCLVVTGESGCPACNCQPLCSPPKCEAGCYVDLNPRMFECPGCVCGPAQTIPVMLCSDVKCGPLCHKAFDGTGCPTCICDPSCSVPKCDVGCSLTYKSEDGPCPQCVCDANKMDSLCPEITCGSFCEKKPGLDGCPTCSCDPHCSAPKCEDGCFLEYDQTAGPCPACVCISKRALYCAPVLCGANCIESIDRFSGCPSCVCQPQCSSPKCDKGCHVEHDPLFGGCPACVCPVLNENEEIQCSLPICDPKCKIDFNSDPCPSCSCPDDQPPLLCSPPVCEGDCHIDYSSTPCPSCVCDQPADLSGVQCSLPNCDPGCRIDYSTKPCPSCSCLRRAPPTLLCSPPKCDSGCRIDYTTKPCPSCNCNDPAPMYRAFYQLECSLPKCDEGCRVNYNAKPCPECVCRDTFPSVQCSQPNCPVGCRIDYSTKPCPSCSCEDQKIPNVQCSQPYCQEGCRIDYSTKPCPSCSCEDKTIPNVQCSQPYCPGECSIDYSTKPCPSCSCEDQSPPSVECSMPKCDPGCHVDYSTQPCPSCSCEADLSGVQCSLPKCDPGCRMDYSTKPCPSCSCLRKAPFPSVQCSQPYCPVGCGIDYSTKPCPSCSCEDQGIQCSPPKCDAGCHIDYTSKPCPSCKCDEDIPQVQCAPVKCDDPGCIVDYFTKPCPSCFCGGIQCSPPKCDAGCHIDYTSKPCPSCKCDEDIPQVQCAPVKCDDPGCVVDYFTKPCPSCFCGGIQCSPPKCDAGCHIDYTSKPCPSCKCDEDIPQVQCAPVKCDDPGCVVDYFTKPCPSCFCGGIQCSPPKCDAGCHIDYTSKPCPSCKCDEDIPQVQCAPVKCDDPGCVVDYFTKPCPSCFCGGIQCSPPKCDAGCHIDYTSKPCPSCKCDEGIPQVQCAPVKCDDPGCIVDYSTKPCPSCFCGDIQTVLCSPPKCEPPCDIDYTTKPCPSCSCTGNGDVPTLNCSPPKCDDPGCHIDYSSKPCPSCSCSESGGMKLVHCSPPKCDVGCTVDYSTKPCPSCACKVDGIPTVLCTETNCEPGCQRDESTKPCPSCLCENRKQVACAVPRCGYGCRIDHTTEPCPMCVCDRSQRQYVKRQAFPLYTNDFMCSLLKCAPGCVSTPPSPNERCQSCSCTVEGGKEIKCGPMQCRLPCRWKRVAPHVCPYCDCFNVLPGNSSIPYVK